MRPQVMVVSSAVASAPIPMDRLQVPFNVGFGVVISGGGSATYTVQHTFDDILNGATATWFDNSVVAAQTINKDGNYAFPVTAIRLNVTVYGSGTVTLTALQGNQA